MTGMRGLCNGLGPAMFGVIFYLFHVDLNDEHNKINSSHSVDTKLIRNETIRSGEPFSQFVPGPPFVFGAMMVIVAILVATYIPESPTERVIRRVSGELRYKE